MRWEKSENPKGEQEDHRGLLKVGFSLSEDKQRDHQAESPGGFNTASPFQQDLIIIRIWWTVADKLQSSEMHSATVTVLWCETSTVSLRLLTNTPPPKQPSACSSSEHQASIKAWHARPCRPNQKKRRRARDWWHVRGRIYAGTPSLSSRHDDNKEAAARWRVHICSGFDDEKWWGDKSSLADCVC